MLVVSVAATSWLAAAADSAAVRPPFLIRADQDNIPDQVSVQTGGPAPVAADFTAGLLTSPQTNFTARPAISLVQATAGAKAGDYTVDLSIEALMPFGDSSADLFYKGTQIDLLRFSRPGVGVSPASGTAFVARQPGPLLLVLENHSGFAYKQVSARLRFQDRDFCEFDVDSAGGADGKKPAADCGNEKAWHTFELPQYKQVTLRAASLPREWFQNPGSGYARSSKASGTLTIHYTAAAAAGQPAPRIHEQNLPIEMQFEAGTIPMGFTLIRIFSLLILGAAASFLLRVSLPNMKRKRALKDQLAEMNKLIGGLSGEVDSRLRTLLGAECLALNELRTETLPLAPNYADYAKRVEQGLPVLAKKIAVAQRLGSALERRRDRINSGYEYRILEDSGGLLNKVSRMVQKDQIGDDDWLAINQNLAKAEAMLEEPDQQALDTFQAGLASRWLSLRAHFAPKDGEGKAVKGKWAAPEAVKDMQPLFDSLPQEFFSESVDDFKKWIQDESGTGGDADILLSALEYVEYVETIAPPKNASAVWKTERDSLCDLLANSTTQKLFDASDAIWRLHENVFQAEIKTALTEGQARLVVQPENPGVNQRCRIALTFPDPHLDAATARDQLTCRWTFTTKMLGPRHWLIWFWHSGAVDVKHEQGWHVFHYFEKGSLSAKVSVEVYDGNEMVALGANPHGEFPEITVTPTPSWRGKERYARTILEIAQLAAALLVPLAALASTTVNGGGEGSWWTLAGLGFGTDTIKSIILGKDDSAAPPAK
jgi:hypothetical protein